MEKKKYSYNGYILFLLPVIFKCLSLNAKEAYDEYKPIKISKYIKLKIKENFNDAQKNNQNYSSNNFIKDFFINDITTDLNLGTPKQKINSFLNPENICFQFIEKNKWKNINNKNQKI